MTTATETSIVPPIPQWAIAELGKATGRDLEDPEFGWRARAPRWYSPPPDQHVPGAWFDVEEVKRVLRVLHQMPHTKPRQWKGKPFIPEPWQLVWIIAPIFGWKDAEGLRIARLLWHEVPRKNGKSTLSSRLALYLLTADAEEGPEVYAAATSTVQAGQVFNEAKVVGERSEALQKRCKFLRSVIEVPKTFGVFRVLSKVAESVHGMNVSGAVIDEVHLHKRRDLVDAIETGTGSREQPLVCHITTAGDDDETTIYAEKHNLALRIAKGEVLRTDVWVAIWCADTADDPWAEDTWRKANPNYGISVRKEYIATAMAEAQDTPTTRGRVLRLHLGIRHGLHEGLWPGAEAWGEQGNAGMVVPEKLRGRVAYGGIVAASATDLAALCWVFSNPEKGAEGVWALWRYFLPGDRLRSLDKRTDGSASVWRDQGHLIITDGDQLDINALVEQVRLDVREFDTRELAYYVGNVLGVVQPILEERLVEVVQISANTPGSAMVDWEAMLRKGTFNHGGHPITAWQVSHSAMRTTAGGTPRFDIQGSPDNIYGVLAGELALRRHLVNAGAKRDRTLQGIG